MDDSIIVFNVQGIFFFFFALLYLNYNIYYIPTDDHHGIRGGYIFVKSNYPIVYLDRKKMTAIEIEKHYKLDPQLTLSFIISCFIFFFIH